MASCLESKIKKYDLEFRKVAIECLIVLGGTYDRKRYIPGKKNY